MVRLLEMPASWSQRGGAECQLPAERWGEGVWDLNLFFSLDVSFSCSLFPHFPLFPYTSNSLSFSFCVKFRCIYIAPNHKLKGHFSYKASLDHILSYRDPTISHHEQALGDSGIGKNSLSTGSNLEQNQAQTVAQCKFHEEMWSNTCRCVQDRHNIHEFSCSNQ